MLIIIRSVDTGGCESLGEKKVYCQKAPQALLWISFTGHEIALNKVSFWIRKIIPFFTPSKYVNTNKT
jgi:hypothetical protein